MAITATTMVPSERPDPYPEPLLEAGDRLTRKEFERRYERMPHLKKAELIEGIVYMPSPVRANLYALPYNYPVASCPKARFD